MTLRAPIKTSQYGGSVLVAGPQIEPVSASELQEHLRADNSILPFSEAAELITEARQEIEDHLGLAMINQSWRLSLDDWPNGQRPWWDGVIQGTSAALTGGNVGTITLPRYPVGSITSMTVYDAASNATSVNVAQVFDVDTYQRPARIRLKLGQTWPIAMRPTNAIEIVYLAGYGPEASDVPAPMRRAIKMMAGFMFAHRGDGCSASDAYTESGAAGILGKYKVKRI